MIECIVLDRCKAFRQYDLGKRSVGKCVCSDYLCPGLDRHRTGFGRRAGKKDFLHLIIQYSVHNFIGAIRTPAVFDLDLFKA